MSDELKSTAAPSPPLLEFGPFRLDPVKRLLLRDGTVVHLTPKAVEVLAVLVEHRGRALEKDELMRAVWPDTVVEENNLARSVSSLRKALGEQASERRYVLTIPGRGYRFVAPVREVPRATDEVALRFARAPEVRPDDAGPSISSEGGQEAGPPPSGRPSTLESSGRGSWAFRWRTAITAPLGALAVLLVVLGVTASRPERQPSVHVQARLARNARGDPVAHELYLRGRHFFDRRRAAADAEPDLRKSVRYLEQAIARDPNLAEAHAALAFTYRVIAHRGFLPPWEATRESERYARRALELDPQLVDAHVAVAANLGFARWDWAAAEREFQRALELDPGNAHARLWYSFMLLHLGRMDEAAVQSAHGLRSDSFHPLLWDNHVAALVALGRGEEAIERARESVELEPSRVDFLGWVYLRLGREEDALAEFERAGSERGLAYAHAMRGEPSGVRALLARLEARSKERYVSPVELGKLFALLGEKDQAFARLEEAYRTRAPAVAGITFLPEFASLRSDPRYRDLLRRLNLQ